MDPQLTAHYHAEQRRPVFMRGTPQPKQPQRPLWPLLAFAFIAGAMVVGGALRMLQLLS